MPRDVQAGQVTVRLPQLQFKTTSTEPTSANHEPACALARPSEASPQSSAFSRPTPPPGRRRAPLYTQRGYVPMNNHNSVAYVLPTTTPNSCTTAAKLPSPRRQPGNHATHRQLHLYLGVWLFLQEYCALTLLYSAPRSPPCAPYSCNCRGSAGVPATDAMTVACWCAMRYAGARQRVRNVTGSGRWGAYLWRTGAGLHRVQGTALEMRRSHAIPTGTRAQRFIGPLQRRAAAPTRRPRGWRASPPRRPPPASARARATATGAAGCR